MLVFSVGVTLCSQKPVEPPGPMLVLIDSIDTLASDLGSNSATVAFLRKILVAIASQPQGSKLVLPVSAKSPLLPQLISVSLSNTLTHITLHSPELVSHVAKTYLTPPPLADVHPTPKFWSVFLPVAQRGEGERLVLAGQDGAKLSMNEGVAEILVRAGRKGPERTLEAWRLQDDVVIACKCGDLTGLQGIAVEREPVADSQVQFPIIYELLRADRAIGRCYSDTSFQLIPNGFADCRESTGAPSLRPSR